MPKTITAIGLMSGTSLDGIDAAIITTNGETIASTGAAFSMPYTPEFRQTLRGLLDGKGDILAIEKELTERHAEAVRQLLTKAGISPDAVGVIGFHGQTVIHRPEDGLTQQIGNGSLLAALTGIDVVCDFRRRDMAAGGQGAPLVPVYHAALVKGRAMPVAVVNIGGVANVTWIGRDGTLLAFDTGPGNALLDDWVAKHTGKPCDAGGIYSAAGKADTAILRQWMQHPYFRKQPPKSLDRNSFDAGAIASLSLEDGAATLAAFTVESIAQAAQYFPAPASEWFIAGGGRHNPTLMQGLQKRMNVNVQPVEALGVDGDMAEAQAFAYLAVRSLHGLPLTFPLTTGVRLPQRGGAFYRA